MNTVYQTNSVSVSETDSSHHSRKKVNTRCSTAPMHTVTLLLLSAHPLAAIASNTGTEIASDTFQLTSENVNYIIHVASEPTEFLTMSLLPDERSTICCVLMHAMANERIFFTDTDGVYNAALSFAKKNFHGNRVEHNFKQFVTSLLLLYF
jgi:hypothetical protein